MLWGRLPRNRAKQARVFLMVRSGYRPDRGLSRGICVEQSGNGLAGQSAASFSSALRMASCFSHQKGIFPGQRQALSCSVYNFL